MAFGSRREHQSRRGKRRVHQELCVFYAEHSTLSRVPAFKVLLFPELPSGLSRRDCLV